MNNEEFLKLIKVLDDNTRLQIIQILSKNETMCACKLLEELDIVQSTLSHHMKLLMESGIVICKKEGKWNHYSLVKEKVCDLAQFIKSICQSD